MIPTLVGGAGSFLFYLFSSDISAKEVKGCALKCGATVYPRAGVLYTILVIQFSYNFIRSFQSMLLFFARSLVMSSDPPPIPALGSSLPL